MSNFEIGVGSYVKYVGRCDMVTSGTHVNRGMTYVVSSVDDKVVYLKDKLGPYSLKDFVPSTKEIMESEIQTQLDKDKKCNNIALGVTALLVGVAVGATLASKRNPPKRK